MHLDPRAIVRMARKTATGVAYKLRAQEELEDMVAVGVLAILEKMAEDPTFDPTCRKAVRIVALNAARWAIAERLSGAVDREPHVRMFLEEVFERYQQDSEFKYLPEVEIRKRYAIGVDALLFQKRRYPDDPELEEIARFFVEALIDAHREETAG